MMKFSNICLIQKWLKGSLYLLRVFNVNRWKKQSGGVFFFLGGGLCFKTAAFHEQLHIFQKSRLGYPL